MDRKGKPKFYKQVLPENLHRQRSRPGAVWQITNIKNKPLGHFRIGDRTSRAIIPADGKER